GVGVAPKFLQQHGAAVALDPWSDQKQRWQVMTEGDQGIRNRSREHHLITLPCEQPLDCGDDGDVIVDEEDWAGHSGSDQFTTGRPTRERQEWERVRPLEANWGIGRAR